MPKKTHNKTLPKRKPVALSKTARLQKFASAILPKNSILRRIVIGLGIFLILFFSVNYSIAQWYIFKHRNEPLVYGATFIPEYAKSLGVEPKETMDAMINDLGFRHFRLVSYWDSIEKQKGTYDFTELDWQFKKAEESNSKVSLAIGLRQPRWPECHQPSWTLNRPISEWYPNLKTFMVAVINRYKTSPALESYQLENEFFLSVFGECPDFSRDRLVDEYNLVKQTDDAHPVIVSRSNNIIGVPLRDPRPDMAAVSVYKRVWDKSITHRYVEYPFPAWFYATLAGSGELLTGRPMMIHELQAEPWLPEGFNMRTAPVSEQDKSLSPERLANRFEYARGTGVKRIDMWGVEWWYARKVVNHQPDVWDTARQQLQIKD